MIRSRVNIAIEDVQAEMNDLNGRDEIFRDEVLERVRFYLSPARTAGQVLGIVKQRLVNEVGR